MSLWKKRRVRVKKEAFARLRTAVFRRDRWRCRNPFCRSPRNLTVHHMVKRSQGGIKWKTSSPCAGHVTSWWREGSWKSDRERAQAGFLSLNQVELEGRCRRQRELDLTPLSSEISIIGGRGASGWSREKNLVPRRVLRDDVLETGEGCDNISSLGGVDHGI